MIVPLIGRMRLDDLARPFRIEQVGEALRRVLGLHQIGVVAERGEPYARQCESAVRVAMLGREMLRDLLRHIGREPAVALPDDEMRRVRGVDDVGGVDVARHLLRDALEDALGAGAFDPHRDAGIFRLERLGELLGDRQIHRGVEGELAFLLRSLDQRRRHASAGGRRRDARRERGAAAAGERRSGGGEYCHDSILLAPPLKGRVGSPKAVRRDHLRPMTRPPCSRVDRIKSGAGSSLQGR